MSERIFIESGDFNAYCAAAKWLRENDYSYGSMQADAPTAIFFGNCLVSEWRNLSPKERGMKDGDITGDFRYGPVKVRIVGGPLA